MLQKRTLIAEITEDTRIYLLAGWVKKIGEKGFIMWDMSGEVMIHCNPGQLKIRDVVSVEVITGKELNRNDLALHATRIEVINHCEEDILLMPDHEDYSYLKFFNHDNILYAKKINEIEGHVRNFLSNRKFVETKIPLLWTSVQEYGFNEFKVYNEISGLFEYVLLQSPNILNLLITRGGIERVFQFHPCFRLSEESSVFRTDVLVEFTQLAISCNFFTNEDGKELVEQMLKDICKKCFEVEIVVPFPILDYHESMRLYGSDKPDLRYREFFQPLYTERTLSGDKTYKTLLIPYALHDSIIRLISTKIKDFISTDSSILRVHEGQISKVYGVELDLIRFRRFMDELPSIDSGVIVLIDAEPNLVSTFYSSVIRSLTKYKTTDKYAFCWIENYPYVEEDPNGNVTLEEIGQNIFTKRHENVSKGLDLILNGVEIASGSEKEYREKEFIRSLDLLQLEKDKYFYYLKALRSGSPPVFTIGIGWERLLWKLLNTKKMQDVMIFPWIRTNKEFHGYSGVIVNE